jgi:hypothetical protein
VNNNDLIEEIAHHFEQIRTIDDLSDLVDDVNPRIDHAGDFDDAKEYCHWIAKRIRKLKVSI